MHVQCQVHVVLKQLVRLELPWRQPTANNRVENSRPCIWVMDSDEICMEKSPFSCLEFGFFSAVTELWEMQSSFLDHIPIGVEKLSIKHCALPGQAPLYVIVLQDSEHTNTSLARSATARRSKNSRVSNGKPQLLSCWAAELLGCSVHGRIPGTSWSPLTKCLKNEHHLHYLSLPIISFSSPKPFKTPACALRFFFKN